MLNFKLINVNNNKAFSNEKDMIILVDSKETTSQSTKPCFNTNILSDMDRRHMNIPSFLLSLGQLKEKEMNPLYIYNQHYYLLVYKLEDARDMERVTPC